MPNIWNATVFVDLDWPLNVSRRMSASAELLVKLRTLRTPGVETIRTHPLVIWQFDLSTSLFTQVMKQVLVKTGVLLVVGSNLLFAFDLHTDVHANCARHRRLVCPFLCKVKRRRRFFRRGAEPRSRIRKSPRVHWDFSGVREQLSPDDLTYDTHDWCEWQRNQTQAHWVIVPRQPLSRYGKN